MNYFENYCQQIIRPPKRTYFMHDLGPKMRVVNGHQIVRVDFQFQSRELTLQASYFIQETLQHRCAIYLHGNASCRIEGTQHVEFMAKLGINLCVVDLAGCGLSDGNSISMGYYEQMDVLALMEHIQYLFGRVDQFILWGRSMGAVTALMLAQHKLVSCYIIDSAFTNFRTLIYEIGSKQFGFLSFLLCVGVPLLRRKILENGQFDIDLVNPIGNLSEVDSQKQFYFLAGQDDQLIRYQHTEQLYLACRSRKVIDICDGDHNSQRPLATSFKIREFLNNSFINDEHSNHEYVNKVAQHFVMRPPMKQSEESEGKQMRIDLERRTYVQQIKKQIQDERDYDVSELDNYI